MTNPFLNNKNTIFRGSRVLIPFFSDLNTFYKKIVGTIFNESINNLPARFLPRVADFNGSDDFIDTGIDLSEATSVELILYCHRSAIGTFNTLGQVDGSSKRISILWFNDDAIYCEIGNLSSGYGVLTEQTQTGWFELKLIYDGSGGTNADKCKLYIDDILQVLSFQLDDIPTSLPVLTNNVLIGKELTIFTNNAVSYVSVTKAGTLQGEYYPTGQGSHEYDISGNGNHGTIEGTGTHYDFDLNGSTRPNDGHSIWQKALNPDIQVQFDINGAAISLTEGVNIPAGYSHERDVPAGGDDHNIYKSLVDMEYGSLLQCDTDGVAYATQTESYGLVFDGIVNKSDASAYYYNFISDGILEATLNEGYQIYLSSTEAVYLRRTTTFSVLFNTVDNYINHSTDYRILVWRNEETNEFVTGVVGTFVVYIQGKNKAITNKQYLIPNINEMELVNPSGGTGTNPITDNTHTTSKFITPDLSAGDKASKININGKYISPYDFTVSTGAYSIIDNAKNAIYNRKNQTVWSQASLFYNEFKPFIYHITELADPRIYNKSGEEFLDGTDRDKIFGKVKRDGTDIIRLDELENYENQKAGSALNSVTNYNKITDIYHI